MTICRLIFFRMRNVSDKSCRENQNTHFVLNNFFPKIVRVMRECGIVLWSQRGRRWQYGGAMNAGLVRLHMRTHRPAPMQPHPHTHTSARARARTGTHSHTRAEVCNSLLVACPRQQWFRERAWMASFMCIACLVLSQNYEMRLLALSCLFVLLSLPVCPSDCVEKLVSHWTDFQ